MLFKVDEKVLLKVSPMKGVMRLNKKGKFIPWYIGPFKVFKDVGLVAYRVALLPIMLGVHLVFHVSTHKRNRGYGDYIIK